MADLPWLTIIGLGEDGPDGLSRASLAALENAEVVMGAARHLALLPDLTCETITWPVPFADGIPALLDLRGRQVVALASGDPFWFGAGSVLARHLQPGDWRALPGPSTFSLAAARLGWPLETTTCLGLHAAPLTRMRPHLAPGARLIVLLRDGGAVADLATYLCDAGFGASDLHVLEALGGPREKYTKITAQQADKTDFSHPVCVGLEPVGRDALPLAPGRDDALFDHDGQITKSPVRAVTLAALAPRPGQHLWDIGGGSGSVSVEWLLCHPSLRATAIEADPDRATRLTENARAFGVDRLQVVEARAPDGLDGIDLPDTVFVGGGLSEALLQSLWALLPAGVRLVANAVTIESEALLARWQAEKGGDLLRIELTRSNALGSRQAWKPAYPVVQWSVLL